MCCGPYDYDYPTFGGKYQRTDPAYGRVGSPFSDPATAGYGPSADSNLEESDPGRMREAPKNGLDELEDIDNLMEDLENQIEIPDQQKEILPIPKASPEPDADGSTASRLWRQRPLRRGQQWR